MMWTLPVLATRLRHQLPPSVSVVFFLENVDMAASRKPPIDEVLGVTGLKACASRCLPCNRPREFWSNLIFELSSPKEVSATSVLDSGWRPLWELLGGTSKSKFGTFLRPFPPGKPREFPAAYTRLPLSTYSETGLVYRPDAPPEVLAKIKDLTRRCARCDTRDLKTVGGSAVKLRGELCDYVHSSGLRWVRPLNGRERDLCLGFPPDASALPGEEPESSINWGRLEATGNSYAVSVVADLLRPLAEAILSSSVPPLRPGFPSTMTAADALAALGASSAEPLQGSNSRR